MTPFKKNFLVSISNPPLWIVDHQRNKECEFFWTLKTLAFKIQSQKN